MSKINSTTLKLNQNNLFQGYIGLGYSNGLWMWNDGTPLSPETNWAPQQPSRNDLIRCASTGIKLFDADWNWKWNDLKCDRILPVFCEVV
ncbi:Collectin-11 [Mactra antiquata]